MMKMFLSFMMIFLSFLMFFLNHPLSMGLMILIQTMLTCLISSIMLSTYWFSYILFLTFLGGLLVLFIYVSSIASNELFKVSLLLKMFLLLSIFISFLFMMFSMNNLFWLNFNINNLEMNNFFNMTMMFFNNENKINLSKLYNNQTFLMMMMMIIYLFITLIAVVKITNIFYGPLRSSIN